MPAAPPEDHAGREREDGCEDGVREGRPAAAGPVDDQVGQATALEHAPGEELDGVQWDVGRSRGVLRARAPHRDRPPRRRRTGGNARRRPGSQSARRAPKVVEAVSKSLRCSVGTGATVAQVPEPRPGCVTQVAEPVCKHLPCPLSGVLESSPRDRCVFAVAGKRRLQGERFVRPHLVVEREVGRNLLGQLDGAGDLALVEVLVLE